MSEDRSLDNFAPDADGETGDAGTDGAVDTEPDGAVDDSTDAESDAAADASDDVDPATATSTWHA
ncbi:hypothetical protein, partial [Halorubrum sp. AJ67]|uniref:hypothetical protein n=1 Tax=Halorubrum sp. AJ67 TaxID=1173487 RepID=UPI00064F69AD